MSSTSTTRLERLAAGVIMAGFPAQSVPDEMRELIARGVRGFIFFARNVGLREQVAALSTELRDLAGEDAIVAIDHEGGRVNRLLQAASLWPSPMAWAATGDLALTRRASRLAAEELASLGITLNLAPVADILSDYHNPVLTTRCFSDDPIIAADFVAAFVEGHADAGVSTSAKHFPGHGGTPVDSHVALPRVDLSLAHLLTHDIVPFVAAIRAGVASLMISHVWYAGIDQEETPATVSQAVVRLARESLDFDGPIITDSMEMGAIAGRWSTQEAAVRAIAAGCDLLTVSHEPDQQRDVLEGLIAAVEGGTLPIQRLEDANRRVNTLRSPRRADPSAFPAGGPALAQEITRRAVTVVRDEQYYLPLTLPPQTSLGVITFPTKISTQVENQTWPKSHLVQAVQSFHPTVIDFAVGGRENLLERVAGVETVIVGTAFATGRPEQAEVVRALVGAGKKVIVLGLRDPFDILSFPNAPCYLVAFDDSALAARASAAVMFGRAEASGRLPVEIPHIYQRDHGWRST